MMHGSFCRLPAYLCALICASVALADANIVIKTAPALPAPSGSVTHVYNISDFYSAVNNAGSGTTIMIHPGTYQLNYNVPQFNRSGVTIRGSTGNHDDVVIVGGGMNTPNSGVAEYGFQINVNNITIADLTIRDVYYHGIQIRGENSVSNVLLHNVKILNAGERFIKGSSATGMISSNVTIEYCWLEQTQDFVSRPSNPVDTDNYIGGIDAIGTSGWKIHDCYIKNIHGLTGGGRGGVFLWGGATGCTVERNCVIGCDRGIAFGNPTRTVPYHTTNGIIRNNFIVRPNKGGNLYAMELCGTKNLKVYNNTIYCESFGYNVVHLEDGVTTGLKLYNNIICGYIYLDNSAGAVTASTTGSITGFAPQAEWFVEPDVGDLRLTSLATDAIDQGQPSTDVTDDFFARARDNRPDIGAYEALPLPHVVAFSPDLGLVQFKSPPVNCVTVSFDRDVTINSNMVSVVGANTGSHNNFTFSYDSAYCYAALQWAAALPNDTYTVTISDAVTGVVGGWALDGEVDPVNPVLPSGNGVAGGAFAGVFYSLAGDINCDRCVNVSDLQILVSAWGKRISDAGFVMSADLNIDYAINVGDLQILVANWGASVPAAG